VALLAATPFAFAEALDINSASASMLADGITGIGDKKIQVIKVVREVTSLGLKEAKDLVDGAPSTVKEAISKEEAEQVKAKLEEQGATVALK
jgi:large subunit ribosomal protein L7/L12